MIFLRCCTATNLYLLLNVLTHYRVARAHSGALSEINTGTISGCRTVTVIGLQLFKISFGNFWFQKRDTRLIGWDRSVKEKEMYCHSDQRPSIRSDPANRINGSPELQGYTRSAQTRWSFLTVNIRLQAYTFQLVHVRSIMDRNPCVYPLF